MAPAARHARAPAAAGAGGCARLSGAEPIRRATRRAGGDPGTGNRILVVARTKIRGTASGVEIEETNFHVWTVVDELAVRFEIYSDRDQALAAMRGNGGA